MRTFLRTLFAVIIGLATLLAGQAVIENAAWWWTNSTATFDDPLLNAAKFGVSSAVALALGLTIGLRPARRRRLL
jgi:divalent metal cation (Fe/Co/Zn/Cd) transporter